MCTRTIGRRENVCESNGWEREKIGKIVSKELQQVGERTL